MHPVHNKHNMMRWLTRHALSSYDTSIAVIQSELLDLIHFLGIHMVLTNHTHFYQARVDPAPVPARPRP